MDVDIDLPSSFDSVEYFDWTKASLVKDEEMRKHPVGVYPQNIPIDPVSKLSAIPYKDAEEIGYFKIDFLHNYVYDKFESREEIETLLEIDPPWELLKSPSTVKQLFQLGKHFDTVRKMQPQSVEDLADVLAIIRPGKSWLVPKYLQDKSFVRNRLYSPDENGYSFKKAHAVAYALVVVLQLHLISMGLNF